MTLVVGIVVGVGMILFLRWISLQFDHVPLNVEEEEEEEYLDWQDC